MKLREIVERLELIVVSDGGDPEARVVGGHCGDLLSHVLASARPGELWITVQRHVNVAAVAQVAGLAGVVLADGVRPDDALVSKASADGVAVYASPAPAFELAGRLHRLLAAEGR